jgi:predicted Abi (CAAX) family protease
MPHVLLRRAFWAWPAAAVWRETLLTGVAFAVPALPIGFRSGLLICYREPMAPHEYLILAAQLLLMPALAEELVFRGLLLPHPAEAVPPGRVVRATALSIAAYVAWHPLNGRLLSRHMRHVLGHRGFLVITALLGLACSRLYLRSGSIWPSVLLHWLCVFIWAGWLGGRRLLHASNDSLILR